MKITASTFDVKVKNLEEFIMEYFKLDINELYELAEKYDYYGGYRKIFEILLENKDIDGLYKLAENKSIEESNKNIIYKEIFEILLENKDINGLYKLAENSNLSHSDKKTIYEVILQILSYNKDIDGLHKLKSVTPCILYFMPGAKQFRRIFSQEIDYKIRELKNNK